MTDHTEQTAVAAGPSGQCNGTAPVGTARAASNGAASTSLWQQLCAGADPADRMAWLRAVQPDGLIYAHQLTAPTTPAAERRGELSPVQIVRGASEPLPPLTAGTAVAVNLWLDGALDESQREVVAKALASPDVFLIQGLPGIGKSRVAVEVIRQAAARGERVLVTAAAAHLLDSLLAALAGPDVTLPLRCLGSGEREEALAPAARACTATEQARRIRDQALPIARQQLELCRTGLAQHDHTPTSLAELAALARSWQEIAQSRAALASTRLEMTAQVKREAEAPGNSPASEFSQALEAETQRHRSNLQDAENRLQELTQTREQAHDGHARWVKQVQIQLRIVAARKSWQFFRLIWWRARFQGRAAERLEEFRCREAEAADALAAAEAQLQDATSQLDLEQLRHDQAVEQLAAHEIAKRLTELEDHERKLLRHEEELLDGWRRQCSALPPTAGLADHPGLADLTAAARNLEVERARLTARLAAAESWIAVLESTGLDLPARLFELANVIAVPMAGLADLHTGAHCEDFDRVVVDHAHAVRESDLVAAAGRGKRLLLIGQPPLAAAEPGLPSAPFHRLWHKLHCDPRRLPYDWVQEGRTLACRLRPVPEAQQSWVESERLSDQPDVELRILVEPGAAPVLAEVVFPSDRYPITKAKAFVYQHLDELPLRPVASRLVWQQQGGRLYLHLGASPSAGSPEQYVPVEAGVSEVVGCHSAAGNGSAVVAHWSTRRLEFDLTAGWDQPRAERWLRERTGLCDVGRTGWLDAPSGVAADLAAFTADVLFGLRAAAGIRSSAPRSRRASGPDPAVPVQWVNVTAAPAAGRGGKRAGSPGRLGPKGVIGLEILLSDRRERQRLPGDARERLPADGIVNLAEAQAIVRCLARFVRRRDLFDSESSAGAAPLLVLAWQPAQVQLLRWLWQHEQAPPAPAVEFAAVRECDHRGAAVVLLSLCRSSSQRAEAYSETADEWQIALTAARRSLILFGDPLALARRAECRGRLGTQDEATAAWERGAAARLLAHLHAPDAESRLLAVCEGSPP